MDQAATLGELLGMNHAFGGFMDYQGGRYGMAILSHCEIRRIEPVRLTDGNEPRVALIAEVVDVNDSTLTVIDVRFDWVADDGFRFTQAGEVASYFDRVAGRWILVAPAEREACLRARGGLGRTIVAMIQPEASACHYGTTRHRIVEPNARVDSHLLPCRCARADLSCRRSCGSGVRRPRSLSTSHSSQILVPGWCTWARPPVFLRTSQAARRLRSLHH